MAAGQLATLVQVWEKLGRKAMEEAAAAFVRTAIVNP
jgi:hypothetical protein